MSSMASTGLNLGLNLPLGSKVDGGEAGNGNDDAAVAAAAAEERRLRIQIEQLQQQQQRVAAAAALKTAAGENRMTYWICIIRFLI